MGKESDNFVAPRAFFRWKPAAWLRVSGADAGPFLQGQLSNDLRRIEAAGSVYGLWLNHKGRVLADAFVLRGHDGEYRIGSYFSSGAAIREHLEAFVVADDVTIADETGAWSGVTVWGSEELEAKADEFWFAGRRGGEGCREGVFPAEREAEVLARFGAIEELTPAEMERRRIVAGIPAVPADIGPGELPNEGGLDAVAVSYTKGCYLGQEVMARLKAMGQVRRRLLRVRGSGSAPAVRTELVQEGRRVGELRSVAKDGDGFVGLALVTLLNLRGGAGLRLAGSDVELCLLDTP